MQDNNTLKLGNRLFARFPREAQDRLIPKMEHLTLVRRQVVYDGQAPIDFIYFPISCVLSLVQIMENGAMSESATIGNEGMTGIALAMGQRMPLGCVIAQLPGEVVRVDVNLLQKIAEEIPGVRHMIQRFGLAFMHQLSQSTGCNQFHSIKQRCARWLLTMRERSPSDEMALTHEFLGEMLGARRATITLIIGDLQRAGILRSNHGRLVIINRAGLESVSCECYAAVRRKYETLVSDPVSQVIPSHGELRSGTLPRSRS
jgi:CRP-like cAMP-binding protein